MNRRGVALLVVLWVLLVAATLAIPGAMGGRLGVDASRNRAAAIIAAFEARGCASRVLAAIDAEVRAAASDAAKERVWNALDRSLTESAAAHGCAVALRSGGARLDVNRADEAALRRFFGAFVNADAASRLAAAATDWRDADDDTRPGGAEAEWYRAAGRPLPSNRPFRAVDEIRLVRGFEAAEVLVGSLSIEEGPIDILHAPLEVLASLPGLGPEGAAELIARRDAGWRPVEVQELFALAASAPDGASVDFLALAQAVQLGATTWVITATARDPLGRIERTEEVTIARGEHALVPVRRRVW